MYFYAWFIDRINEYTCKQKLESINYSTNNYLGHKAIIRLG